MNTNRISAFLEKLFEFFRFTKYKKTSGRSHTNVKLACSTLVSLSLLLGTTVVGEHAISNTVTFQQPTFIVHACGSIDGRSVTNSREALENALNASERTIEIDFSATSDGEIVCLHDWNIAVLPQYKKEAFPLSYVDFMRSKLYGKYTPLSLSDVISYMTFYPDLRIVTDTKSDQELLLHTIATQYPSFCDRFIVQIYEIDQYDTYSALGFQNIIFTLYNLQNSLKSDPYYIISIVGDRKLFGIAFPSEFAYENNYVATLRTLKLPLYVHTVNDVTTIRYFRSIGITGVYTDRYLSGDASLK